MPQIIASVPTRTGTLPARPPRRCKGVVAPLLVLALALAAPPTAPAAGGPVGIIDGEPIETDEFPSTGALIASGSGPTITFTSVVCGATRLASDVLVTRAACVTEEACGLGIIELDTLDFCVSFEADLSWTLDFAHQGDPRLPADAACASGFVPRPGFDFGDLAAGDAGLDELDDVALVFLGEPVADRPFSWLPDELEAEAVQEGLPVDIVGYGQPTADADPFDPLPPVRRHGESFVNLVSEPELQIGDATSDRKCNGDAGSPTWAGIGLVGEPRRLIGVTSRAWSAEANCDVGGIDTRLDHHLAWIDAEMQDACADGLRTDCDEPGIPQPGDDDDSAADDDDSAADDDDSAADDDDSGADDDDSAPVDDDDSSADDDSDEDDSDEDDDRRARGCQGCRSGVGGSGVPGLLAIALLAILGRRFTSG